MKISELILAIGDDNVEFQNLDSALESMDYHHKKGTKITFGTNMSIHHELRGTKKLGLVLWLDRDAVKKAIAEETSDG